MRCNLFSGLFFAEIFPSGSTYFPSPNYLSPEYEDALTTDVIIYLTKSSLVSSLSSKTAKRKSLKLLLDGVTSAVGEIHNAGSSEKLTRVAVSARVWFEYLSLPIPHAWLGAVRLASVSVC